MNSYNEIFSRNIGVFTIEEQNRIRNATISIAGIGGLGAPCAVLLARLGVGRLKLADFDVFEVSNINRQFGAYVDTVGTSKVDVIASEVKRINPSIAVDKFEKLTELNMEKFTEGADFVIDGLDFYAPDTELLLHDSCMARKIKVLTAQSGGLIFTVCNFSHTKSSFRDLFYKDGELNFSNLLRGFFPVLPRGADNSILDRILAGEKVSIPSYSIGSIMGACFVISELVKHIKNNENILYMPDLFIVDHEELTIKKFVDGKIST